MTTTLTDTVRWIRVPGGTCLFGDAAKPRPVPDLWVTETPLTWQQHGAGDLSDRPITGINHEDAVQLATKAGGRLPTSVEWEWIAAGPHRNRYPWGNAPWTPQHAVLTGDGHTPIGPLPAGRLLDGATPHGILDLAGNVWEWTSTPVMGMGFVIRGGSYASKPLYAQTTFLNAVPAERRSRGIAVRPVRPA